MKRFGLSDEEVENIMNGNEGEDGTFLTAAQAIEKGFIQADHVIETPKAIRDQIQAALNDTKDIARIKAVYGLVAPSKIAETIKEQNTISNSITMEKELAVVAALVGITGEKATADNISAKINELKAQAEKSESLQKKLNDTEAKLKEANAELTGAKTSVGNLTADLAKANASLKSYQEAEAKAKEDKVNALIDKAVAECKINDEEREDYLKMAQNDFELAERILAKIPSRDKISAKISEANKDQAKDGVKTEEQKVQAEVEKVIGKNFQFRSLK